MIWEKQGNIFVNDTSNDWSNSHAQVPVVDMCESYWRVYYASRDVLGRSNISFFDVEIGNPRNILYTHKETILNFGEPGTFDHSGIMPTSILNYQDKKYLFYIGWSLEKETPYANAIGVAISEDGGNTFSKLSKGPVIGRSRKEPFFCGTCFVKEHEGLFFAYYLSCNGWVDYQGKKEPLYDIKIGESRNLVDWNVAKSVAIELEENEGGIASASVIKIKDDYVMWFSVRGNGDYRNSLDQSYRILSATSKDARIWKRQKSAVLEPSSHGWDDEMVAYPFVVLHEQKLYMFYNGNGFGKTGIGWATSNIRNE